MFCHDLRRSSTYMILVIIVALGIKNYFLWSRVDLKYRHDAPLAIPRGLTQCGGCGRLSPG